MISRGARDIGLYFRVGVVSRRRGNSRTLHYTTIHYTTLHYTTLHYTTLHYTTPHYTTLHYTTLHYTQYSFDQKIFKTKHIFSKHRPPFSRHHVNFKNHSPSQKMWNFIYFLIPGSFLTHIFTQPQKHPKTDFFWPKKVLHHQKVRLFAKTQIFRKFSQKKTKFLGIDSMDSQGFVMIKEPPLQCF